MDEDELYSFFLENLEPVFEQVQFSTGTKNSVEYLEGWLDEKNILCPRQVVEEVVRRIRGERSRVW